MLRPLLVGGDDTKLKRLRQAAVDLSEILKETPDKTLAFSLAAFDPQVPEADPAVRRSCGRSTGEMGNLRQHVPIDAGRGLQSDVDGRGDPGCP